MEDILEKCTMCPRQCKVNRYEKLGNCKASDKIEISLVSNHMYEEPCISGQKRFWNNFLYALQFTLYFLPKL